MVRKIYVFKQGTLIGGTRTSNWFLNKIGRFRNKTNLSNYSKKVNKITKNKFQELERDATDKVRSIFKKIEAELYMVNYSAYVTLKIPKS